MVNINFMYENKNVFIICISNDLRGVKVIFENFLVRLLERKRNATQYYIFCSWEEMLSYNSEYFHVIITKKDKLVDILFTDTCYFKKWSKNNKVFANVVVSLQNTTINYFNGVKQIVLFQQSIPLSNIKWNVFVKNERKLFYYKHIYPYFIKRFITKETTFVAPSVWVKEKLTSKLNIPSSKVVTINSEIGYVNTKNINYREYYNDGRAHFIYPSNNSKHKNHEVLILAIKVIRDTMQINISKLKIHFTINSNDKSHINKLIKKYNLYEYFSLDGVCTNYEVLSHCKSSNAMLFPSKIESFGLPLIEAAQFGIPIITVNLPYAKEVLKDYPGAIFLPADEPLLWAQEIIKFMSTIIRLKPTQIKLKTGLDDLISLIHKSL